MVYFFKEPAGLGWGRGALAPPPLTLLLPRLDSARTLPPLLYPLNAPEFVLGAGAFP